MFTKPVYIKFVYIKSVYIKSVAPMFLALGLVLSGLAGTAFAHKVIVFAYAEHGQIFVEGGFGGKRPAKQCPVKLLDDTGQILAQGETDDLGKCRFDIPTPAPASLTVELDAGPGHKGTWILDKAELNITDDAVAEKKAEETRPEDLSHGPSPIKIGGGIALIFALAMTGRLVARKKGSA